MHRLAGVLLLALLASCAPATMLPGPPIAPAGGTAAADRGIGGTGISSGAPATAERGIGGTGAPTGESFGAPREALAERGIGGTGIVGVITGFGSIFVNGLEVRYDKTTSVAVDGASASAAALRTGQVVVIDAEGPASSLSARSVTVRYEVSGPVQAVTDGGRIVRVAGQSVAIEGAMVGGADVRPGAWVAVSGLRRPDGTIVATRIDPRLAGTVRVRGLLVQGQGGLRIGTLRVVPALGVRSVPGQYVTVSGRLANGTLRAGSLAPDLVASDPLAHFGSHVRRLFVESYVTAAADRLRTPQGLSVPAAPGVRVSGMQPTWAVLRLERRPGGAARVIGLSFLPAPGRSPIGRPGRDFPPGNGRDGINDRPGEKFVPPSLTAPPATAPGLRSVPRGPGPRGYPPAGRYSVPACRAAGECGPGGAEGAPAR